MRRRWLKKCVEAARSVEEQVGAEYSQLPTRTKAIAIALEMYPPGDPVWRDPQFDIQVLIELILMILELIDSLINR